MSAHGREPRSGSPASALRTVLLVLAALLPFLGLLVASSSSDARHFTGTATRCQSAASSTNARSVRATVRSAHPPSPPSIRSPPPALRPTMRSRFPSTVTTVPAPGSRMSASTQASTLPVTSSGNVREAERPCPNAFQVA